MSADTFAHCLVPAAPIDDDIDDGEGRVEVTEEGRRVDAEDLNEQEHVDGSEDEEDEEEDSDEEDDEDDEDSEVSFLSIEIVCTRAEYEQLGLHGGRRGGRRVACSSC